MDVIRARAESIAADIDKVPGRFNVLEIEGATVVVDYGHNVHSLAAVIEAHRARSRTSAARASTRPPATAATATSSARASCSGAAFDRVILYEDHYRRGRAEGEIMGLFRKGLESATRAKEIVEVAGATKAAEAALTLRPARRTGAAAGRHDRRNGAMAPRLSCGANGG